MNTNYQIPEPFLFNPLKHHIGFIKEFINFNIDKAGADLVSVARDLRHLGSSVMDIYSGSISISNICLEAEEFLLNKHLLKRKAYEVWIETKKDDYRLIRLSDSSQWTLKFHDNPERFVHIFPARNSQHTFRVKSNTLKSALIYLIVIGKDLITGDDLNKARLLFGLSPVKDASDSEAILQMIEILRD
jgi:hypothetical protein